MKTRNTRSPSRQSAAMPGGPRRLRKYIASGILTALVLAVFLTPGLQAPPPAQAQSATALVSNTGQTSMSSGAFLNSTTTKHAMTFTTGSNTTGYIVDSIGYGFRTIADPSTAGADLQMTLNSVAGSGEPGSSLCTLTDPATFTSSAVNTFDAPTTGTECPDLAPTTTYFVVMERLQVTGSSNITSLRTNSDAEDTGAAPGWSIADVAYERSSTAWQQEAYNRAYQIEVNGRPSNIVPLNWDLTPSGLVVGNQFRLLFLTHTGRSPKSSDIADYNTYVQGQANASNAHPAIKHYSAGFTVVGSTADDDARDNTMTTGTGVPIYWLNGSKVADDYPDFYDGSWDDEANPRRRGGDVRYPHNGNVWTGSADNGTAFTSHELGKSAIIFAGLNTSAGPLNSTYTTAPANTFPYYALSQVFTVGTNAPVFTDTAPVSRSVAENTTAVTNIGTPLAAEDLDTGDTLTYRLTGTDASYFTVVSTSGQIKTKSGVTYDHETKPRYSVEVSVTDATNQISIAVTINITDVLEPPSAPSTPTVTTRTGTADSLDVTWTEPETNGGPPITDYDVQYTKTSDTAWTPWQHNGAHRFATIRGLDSGTAYHVEIRASNDEGTSAWSNPSTATTSTLTIQTAPVLVSNTGQPGTNYDPNLGNSSDPIYASNLENSHVALQGFRTGSHNDGYTLASVAYEFESIVDTSTAGAELEFSIHPRNTSGPKTGSPGDPVCILEDPAVFSASGLQFFTVPTSCPKLTKNTTYFIQIKRVSGSSSITMTRTASLSQDDGAAAGWKIINWGLKATSRPAGTGTRFQLAIRGTAGPPDPPAPPPPPDNNPPTGVPTISGNPRVGEDLTAHTDGIEDDDGLNAPNFTYQWVRVDGNSETNIASATDATYILAPEDGGKRIKVKVTFTDDLLTAEGPIASAPTGIVNTPATGDVSITGTPRVGKTLTADISGIIDPDGKPESALTYQWSRTDGVPIAGANGPTYALTDSDADQALSVIVTFPDGRGFTEGPFISPSTEVIVPTDVLVQNTGRARGTGVALTATFPKYAQGFTTGPNVAGYVIDSISASFIIIANPATAGSELTVTLNNLNSNTGHPGNVLCALNDPANFSASGEHTFRAPTTGALCPKLKPSTTYFVVTGRANLNNAHITGSTVSKYNEDSGSEPDWLIADKSYTFGGSFWAGNTQRFIPIRVRGAAAEEVDVPRNWSLLPEGLNAGDEFRLLFLTPHGHQPRSTDIDYYNNIVQAHAADGHADIRAFSSWFRVLGSTPDVDARDNTGTTYTETEKGVPIYWLDGRKVADDYADLYDDTWDEERNPTTRGGNTTPPGRVWSGSEHDGTSAFEPVADSTPRSRAFGSNGNRVRVGSLNSGLGGPLDISETMVYTSHAAYYALSNVFKVVANNPATGVPTISGNPREGEMLTADPSAIGDPDGAENAEFTYQWVLVAGSNETDIAGATESTYVLKDAAGDKIRVKVSFTDDKGNPEGPLTSEPTIPIVADDVLVTNTRQTIASTIGTPVKEAQGFTTGPNGSGYKLDSIGFRFNAIANTATAGSQLTVTLAANNNGSPGNALCTLTDPPTFSSSGVQTFTAPTSGTPCPTLTASTTYFPVIEGSGTNANAITLNTTSSHSEDSGGSTGWSVNDESHYFDVGTWVSESGNIYMIEVKGIITTETVESTHRSWVENREGEATTTYENTGTFSIAQGFRTGDTAGAYEIHEISIDFDRGQPQPKAVQVRIVESSSPDAVNDDATPTTYWKGGNFPKRGIDTDAGTYTFNLALGQLPGTNLLQANTNYFITIDSSSDDPDTAAIVRMTSNESQTSSDGWTVDDHVYVKNKTGDSGWTKQDHQARIRIAGEYHAGISIANEPRAYESCHGNLSHNSETLPEGFESCDFATQVPMGTAGSFSSNLVTSAWLPIYETIDFHIVIWPLVPAGGWVDVKYATQYPPGIYAHGSPAIADVDYLEKSGTVRFLPGEIAKTVSVNIIDDRHEDSNEYLQVKLPSQETRHSSVDNYNLVRRSAFGTIYNSEESVGTQYLNIADIAVTEGEGATAVFTVTLDAEVTAPVTVNYATEDDTATAGTDYTAVSGTLLIPHGQTSATISVPILNDDVYNEDRSFTLNLSDAANATIQDGSAHATIEDDEPATLTVKFGTVPDSHDGVNTFEVFVNFSEGTQTPFLTMQDDVFTITNGTITSASRHLGLRHRWTLTVQPDNGADVTVHLPITTDCAATGAVCTEATPHRALSNSLTATVTGTPLAAAVWSADMLVVSYTENSIGAASTDLFSNIGGTGDLQIRSLWSSIPDRDLRLAFTAGVTGTDDMTLHVGDLALEFPEGSSGNSSFKWTEIDVDWEDEETITVRIDTTLPSTETEEPTSNTPAAGLPTTSGTPQVDQTLTADTSGISDAEGLTNVSYQYQWLAGGADISGATGSTHLLTANEQGQTVQVKVTFTDDADNQESLTSAETLAVAAKPNTAATGQPTISGTPQVRETLTAGTSAISDADGLTNVSYRYQWIANDGTDAEIEGATGSTYTATVKDVGKTIKVRVSFTDDAGNDESLTSVATLAVAAIAPAAPLDLTAAPGAQPETLDVAWNAPSSDGGSDINGYTSQWKLTKGSWDTPADVSQATVTGTSHTITGLTGGVEYTVRVLATNNAGNGPLSTDAAATPAAVPEEPPEPVNNAPTGLPTISGTPQVDQTLTASTSGIGDQDGLENVSYSHQWLADGSTLEGATGTTLLLTASHQGKTIAVRVTFSDDAGNAESLTSAATTAVAAQPAPAVLLTASFANMPADHNGENFTFQLIFSENVDAGYARIRDHAFTVTGGSIASASRITQGSNQSWNVEVNPTGNEAITITLPETTDCDAARAICTDDERMLSHTTSAIVAGPPAISVSDAAAQEEEGAVLEFSVTLSHASSRTVTVAYATSDGSAQAGSDYTAKTGTLTFNPGDTSQTVSVTVLTDSDDEGEETLTLTISNPSQATLDDASGIGAIENGESSSGTQEDPPAVLLTATFRNMPATHNGSAFTFDLSFSENVKAGYARIRDDAFTISGASTIASAVRKTQGSNQNWTITVQPDGNDAITITLPPTTNCNDTGAICTQGGKKLSDSTSAQIAGPE